MTRRHLWVIVCLLAFGLRAWGLDSQSLWSDEDITLDRTEVSARELLAGLPVEQAPLYFLFMRAWTLAAGNSDYALRFPSLLAGVLAVCLLGALARGLAGRRAGSVALVLAAANPFLVWYSQEARMYSQVAALALAALAAAACGGNGGPSRQPDTKLPVNFRAWAASGILAGLATASHWLGALVFVPLVAWAATDLVRRRRLAGWVVFAVACGLVIAPLLPRALAAVGYESWREPLAPASLAAQVVTEWLAGPTAPAQAAGSLVAVHAVTFLAGTVVLYRAGRRRAFLAAVIPVIVVAVLAAGGRGLHPRYFTALLPVTLVASAAALAALPTRPIGALASLALAAGWAPALVAMHTNPAVQKQDYREFVATVEGHAGHEDTVLFLDGPIHGLARRYEMPRSPVKIVNLRSTGAAALDEAGLHRRLAELAAEYPHLWLATDGEAATGAGEWLRANTYPVAHAGFQSITLWRFYAPRRVPWSDTGQADCPGAGPVCAGIQAPARVAAGEVLPVLVTWTRRAGSLEGLRVSVRLGDGPSATCPAGPLAADDAPVGARLLAAASGDTVPEGHGLFIPEEGLLPGPECSHVIVILYNGESLAEVGRWQGPRVEVGP